MSTIEISVSPLSEQEEAALHQNISSSDYNPSHDLSPEELQAILDRVEGKGFFSEEYLAQWGEQAFKILIKVSPVLMLALYAASDFEWQETMAAGAIMTLYAAGIYYFFFISEG